MIVIPDRDSSGRAIMRGASTIKGWHYQAHSVQFSINQINSVYNKDEDGNDLGFSTMKVYDTNGIECITQADADVNGVKTVLKWEPNFDFEVISGNIRQENKQSQDIYMYVNAIVPTGLPSPNDFSKIPFTNGGINMKYIGADEILKTDGRSAKYLPGASGAYFEIIANYSAGSLLSGGHEMSIIFEIYKAP